MNILILQGPNLNLLGLKSAQIKERLTLDKLNKKIRAEIKLQDVQLKFLQTHKTFQAINFLQRNRNKASGLLFIPTSWARTNYTVLETINLIEIETSVVYFEEPYNFGTNENESIIQGENIKPFTGQPVSSCIEGLKRFLNK
jgi:3-dehydroquinate dehydratase-2